MKWQMNVACGADGYGGVGVEGCEVVTQRKFLKAVSFEARTKETKKEKPRESLDDRGVAAKGFALV